MRMNFQSKLKTRMRIAVYCGSFAPVHLGHIAIARAVIDEKRADKVLFVPTGDYWDKEVALELELRIELLKLFAGEEILVDEDKEDCACFRTYDLLARLKIKYPDDELLLLVGGDNAINIDRWYQAQYLLDNYSLIIMPRFPYLKEDIIEKMTLLEKKDYEILQIDVMDISSSYIRDNIDNEEEMLKLISKEEYDLLLKAICK